MRTSILFSFLASILCAFTSEPPKNWLAHQTKDYNIHYPMQWKLDASGKLNTKFILFSANDTSGNRAYIHLTQQEESGDSISLDSILQLNIANDTLAYENFKLISKKLMTINNRHCFRLEFACALHGRVQNWLQQGYLLNHQYFVLSYNSTVSCFNKNYEVATAIMNTFELK